MAIKKEDIQEIIQHLQELANEAYKKPDAGEYGKWVALDYVLTDILTPLLDKAEE